ncbi:MAG: ROK family transcriptional regulator [Thermoflexales bacterium]|nr:ROK family transcriptional regulator [Thermoflexales bacterium]
MNQPTFTTVIQPRWPKATRQQTRAHNTRLVLRTIYEHGPLSRADIARATHLTRTTVSDVVAELMEQGLVAEVGFRPSSGGKPPILLNLVDNARYLIGLDLASDAFRGALVNLRGQIRHRISLPLLSRDGDRALELVREAIDQLTAQADRPLLGIGIGTPGLVDAARGIVYQAVNLDWRDLPLRALLEQRYRLPVYVANDCHAAALAEYYFGGRRQAESLAVVKVERGLGVGIVLSGRLLSGDAFGAGEIGHLRVVEGGEPCQCGHSGCLETVVSTRALLRQARAIAQGRPDSALHRWADAPDAISLDAVLEAFQAGDEATRQTVFQMGRYLGFGVATLVSVLGIRHVVLAGSITRFGEPLLEVVRQEARARALDRVAREVRIDLSPIDSDDMVILGASALVLARRLGLFALLKM